MKGSRVVSVIIISIYLFLFNVDGINAISDPISSISNLNATINSEAIQITFSGTSENVRYYVIEKRLSDKLAYTKVGHLLPSHNNQDLYFSDTEINDPGTYYYRVKTIYKDGHMTISDAITTTIDSIISEKESIHKYIYKEDDRINMRLIINHDATMEGGFYDNSGQLIKQVSKKSINQGLNEFSFDISTFDTGNYLLILKVGKENIIERITVE